MKVVLAGDNLSALYAREQALRREWQAQGMSIATLDCYTLTDQQVADALGAQALFATQRAWKIINLEKIRSAPRLTNLLTQLSRHPDNVLVLIPSNLTPAKKKLFATGWKVENFPLPAAVFTFVESLGVVNRHVAFKNYRQAVTQAGEWSVHALTARQIRLLLATKTGASVSAPPFARAKLQRQAGHFTPEQLASLLQDLFTIEKSIKSGLTPYNCVQWFDITLSRLYDRAAS